MTRIPFTALALAALFALPAIGVQAQNISNADRQKMVENFIQADANDDTAISRKEFETLMKLNAEDGLGRAAQLVKSGRYGRAFGRLDANGDGFVSQPEFQAIAQRAGG